MTNFTDFELDPCLIDAIAQKGYKTPTSIQCAVIPEALDGRNILGSAPTGTGKTAAFLLPAIQHLLDFPRRKPGAPRILILTPTRELAMQVADQAKSLAQFTTLKIETITGGVAYMNHAEIFSTNQDIVVATPGRLIQYIKEENFDCRAIEMLILDEADRMLDMGFAKDMEYIAAETRWRQQTLLFSATMEGKNLEDFAQRLLEDPVTINADATRKERKKIIQTYYYADDLTHKIALLRALLKKQASSKTIVFVKKRERLHEVVQWLREASFSPCYLEGEMVQAKRNEAIKRLKNSQTSILVATDVAARGLDIDDIEYVINFDLPKTADVYLHRIGRTARAGKKGSAISLVEAHDYPLLEKISRYTSEPIDYRVMETLKPQTKAPSSKGKKTVVNKKKEHSTNSKKKESDKKKVKVRARDLKNKGKRRTPSSTQNKTTA